PRGHSVGVSARFAGPTGYRLLSTDYFFENEPFNRFGDAVLVVRGGRVKAGPSAQGRVGVAHDDAGAGPLQHLQVVEVVADGQNLFAPESLLGGDRRQSRPLRGRGVQYVEECEV